MIRQSLPLKALTINKAFRGRRFLSKEYERFKLNFAQLTRPQATIFGYVNIGFIFTMPKKSFVICDVDNLIKPVLDSIVDRGYIEDDRKVVNLTAIKKIGKDFNIEFIINESDTSKA